MKGKSRLLHGVCAIALLIVICLAIPGCRRVVPAEDEELSVYATAYPIYALANAVLKDVPNVQLRCLTQPQDGCLRSYQLSDWDLALIQASDAVIAGGRGLEFYESTLFGLGDGGPAVAAALYNLPLYNASQSHTGGDSESHLEGPNPHLYMSIGGAGMIVESIAASMQALDPDYADQYAKNAAEAVDALNALAEELRAENAELSGQPVILMNEALIYVAQDYELTVAEWIDRESGVAFYDAELENCLAKLRASGAGVILIEEQAPSGFVQALEDAGFAVAKIDILSTRREDAGFETYQQVQRDNAAAIRTAFQREAKR